MTSVLPCALMVLMIGMSGQRSSGGLEPILIATGVLETTSRSFEVPVDTSVSRLDVEVAVAPGIVPTLFRPGGRPVIATDQAVTLTYVTRIEAGRDDTRSLTIFSVTAPDAGVWHLQLAGTSESKPRFYVRAAGATRVSFGYFKFVEYVGMFDSGFNPIYEAMPVAGTTVTAQVILSDGPDKPTFRIVDQAGETIRTLALKSDDPRSGTDAPVGPLEVPAVPFLVVMNATDASGSPIQRQFPTVFRPQTVHVSHAFDRSDITDVLPGTAKKLRFLVTNAGGEPAIFSLHAASAAGAIAGVSPDRVALEPGASATATVSVVVPKGASRGDFVEVRLTATNTADAASMNSATFTIEVASPEDVDGDFVMNDADNCPHFSNADQLDLDDDGVGDACEDGPFTAVTIAGITPMKGPVGTTVTITGAGFEPVPSRNIVMFGHAPATVLSATPTRLVVTVPRITTTYVIVVQTPKGFALSRVPFLVESPRERK